MIGMTRLAAVAVLLVAGAAAPASDASSGAMPGADMVRVPAGPALLGGPGHSVMPGPLAVDLPAFWIDRFEVGNAQYAAFVADTGHRPPMFADDPDFNAPDQPVTGVAWADAQAYCRWAGKRLPSEYQWEKAARGGDGRLYPWGNDFDPARARLTGEAPAAVTADPGDVSPYGVRDMAGNVSEWVADVFLAGATCGAVSAARSLADDAALDIRAYIRGASWAALPHMAKTYHHLWDYPDSYAEFVGFRCAWSPAGDAT